MTKLGFLNKYILQWFFIRLTKCTEEVVLDFQLMSYDLMPDGNLSSRGMGTIAKYEWWSIMFWVFPLTGWKKDYRYINNKQKLWKITKKHEVTPII